MKNIPATCSNTVNYKLIKIEEVKSCCYFRNESQNKIDVIRVDGCAIKTGIRCDFALISTQYPENYIELKGGDVDHAIKQLINSITILSVNKNKAPKRCFIISTNNPLSSTQTQKNKLLFRKDFNAQLEFGRPGATYEI